MPPAPLGGNKLKPTLLWLGSMFQLQGKIIKKKSVFYRLPLVWIGACELFCGVCLSRSEILTWSSSLRTRLNALRFSLVTWVVAVTPPAQDLYRKVKKNLTRQGTFFLKFIFSIHLYVFGAAFFLPPDIGETENNGRGGCDSCAGKGWFIACVLCFLVCFREICLWCVLVKPITDMQIPHQ